MANKPLCYKPSMVDDLPIKLPKLTINNQEIKRASCTKFLRAFLDEKTFMERN